MISERATEIAASAVYNPETITPVSPRMSNNTGSRNTMPIQNQTKINIGAL